MTTKEKRAKINDFIGTIPEAQIEVGQYVKTVGTKYVSIIDTWDTTTIERVTLDDFIRQYC